VVQGVETGMSSAPMEDTPQPGGLIYPPPPPPEAIEKAQPLAAILGETEEKPIFQIARAIDFLGLEKAEELVKKAQEVYAGEGLLTKDGSRKRTLGGCFFRLAREAVTKKQWRKKIKPIAKPARPPKINLAEIAKEAVDWKAGVAMSVKITLVGRPDKIRKPPQGHYAAFTLLSENMPILPKGLPTNIKAKTKYLVMVGARQWNKVEQAITTNPDDKLIIEGFCLIHPEFAGITVLAINCITQMQRKARQEAQRAESLAKQEAGLLPKPSKKKGEDEDNE
jgi:hypothetical protein